MDASAGSLPGSQPVKLAPSTATAMPKIASSARPVLPAPAASHHITLPDGLLITRLPVP